MVDDDELTETMLAILVDEHHKYIRKVFHQLTDGRSLDISRPADDKQDPKPSPRNDAQDFPDWPRPR
jgi:hypothetical protein